LSQGRLAHRVRLAAPATRRVRVVDASLESHASIVRHTSACSSLSAPHFGVSRAARWARLFLLREERSENLKNFVR
jgi:hypothetical protein